MKSTRPEAAEGRKKKSGLIDKARDGDPRDSPERPDEPPLPSTSPGRFFISTPFVAFELLFLRAIRALDLLYLHLGICSFVHRAREPPLGGALSGSRNPGFGCIDLNHIRWCYGILHQSESCCQFVLEMNWHLIGEPL